MAKRAVANVGYKKPPVAHQFKKGQTGNAKGRPKGAPNLATAFRRAMDEKVDIVENGRHKKISKFEAAVKQLVNKAASGDPRAMRQLIAIMPTIDQEVISSAVSVPTFGDLDLKVKNDLVRRIRGLPVMSAQLSQGK